MLWLLAVASPAAAEPPPVDAPPVDAVTLRVAVHHDAGSAWGVAADGAAGQCTVVGSTLHCPAVGPVTFRWGPGGPWELVGDRVLAPGTEGTAILWATGRDEDLVRLDPDTVDAATVRDLFVRTSDHPVGAASAEMFALLVSLVDHPDARVRRALPDALLPYWRHTASDPFPADAPSVVPSGLIVALAQDEDMGVRRRLASRLRDLQVPGEPSMNEATAALLALAAEGGGVQRAAFASLSVRARGGDAPAIATWNTALLRVTTPGPPGRAAANTLAALSKQLEAGPDVRPAIAVQRTSMVQLERVWAVWKAWSADVPFDAVLAERLFRETEGLSPRLVADWGQSDPHGLAAVLRRWEPRAPHGERYAIAARALSETADPELRKLVGDILSAEVPSEDSP